MLEGLPILKTDPNGSKGVRDTRAKGERGLRSRAKGADGIQGKGASSHFSF